MALMQRLALRKGMPATLGDWYYLLVGAVEDTPVTMFGVTASGGSIVVRERLC